MDVEKLIKQITECKEKNRKLEQERNQWKDKVQMSEQRIQKKYDELKRKLAHAEEEGRNIKEEIRELETKKRKLDHDEKLIDKFIDEEMAGDTVVQQNTTETKSDNILHKNETLQSESLSVLSQMKEGNSILTVKFIR